MRTASLVISTILLLLALASAAPEPLAEPAPAKEPPSTDGMILIPAGEFLMGSDEGEKPTNESPAHTMKLKAYLIDRYEVTNRQFASFIEAEGYGKKDFWSESGWAWREKTGRTAPVGWESRKEQLGESFGGHPVVGVSWFEADAFARFAGKRLPTEAEWEYAARGTDSRRYPWGNSIDRIMPGEGETASTSTTPVGSNPADVSPLGIFDMGASVTEWTGSVYVGYPDTKFESRYWGEKARKRLRVARGGSFVTVAEGEVAATKKCRTTYRAIRWSPGMSRNFIGFRLAMDPPKEE